MSGNWGGDGLSGGEGAEGCPSPGCYLWMEPLVTPVVAPSGLSQQQGMHDCCWLTHWVCNHWQRHSIMACLQGFPLTVVKLRGGISPRDISFRDHGPVCIDRIVNRHHGSQHLGATVRDESRQSLWPHAGSFGPQCRRRHLTKVIGKDSSTSCLQPQNDNEFQY